MDLSISSYDLSEGPLLSHETFDHLFSFLVRKVYGKDTLDTVFHCFIDNPFQREISLQCVLFSNYINLYL